MKFEDNCCNTEQFVKKYEDLFDECYDFFTNEELNLFIRQKIKEGESAIKRTVNDYLDNMFCPYFKFDPSMWGYGAEPLETVEDLKDYLEEMYEDF